MLVKRFMYFRPTSHFVDTKEKYTEIRNKHLHGWLLPSLNSTKTVLFCHGNGGNISYSEDKVSALNKLGYNVLIFDYSGYGMSGGIPTEDRCYNDASMMAAQLLEQLNPEDIIMYGTSLGGPIATFVARRYGIPTLILESPLPSIKHVIKSKFTIVSFLACFFPEFDTLKYLDGYTGKSLILHSTDDEVIPYHTIKSIVNVSTEHIPITGYHSNPNIPWQSIKTFIDKNN